MLRRHLARGYGYLHRPVQLRASETADRALVLRTSVLLLGLVLVAGLLVVVSAPVGAAEPGIGRFRTVCIGSHLKQVDPIVNPGPAGTPSGHMHDFAGNTSTDANSTYASMVSRGTTCELSADKAGYWVPALVGPDGEFVPMTRMTAYYSNRPVLASGQETVPFPADFRMIAPAEYPHSYWNCVGDSDHSMDSRQSSPPDCGSSDLRLHVFFPSCWDGVSIDSADHMSHVAYGYRDGSVYGSPGATEDYRIDACPASHPIKIPQVRYRIIFPVSDGTQYTLADGHEIAHADFWNTWDQDVLTMLTDQILNQEIVTPDLNDDNVADFADLSPPCTIKGTPGDDILVGTGGDDVICGLGGDDVIRGKGGDDLLRGGGGNDEMFGGIGADLIFGMAGSDSLFGHKGADVLSGGGGADTLFPGPGFDLADGGRGAQDWVKYASAKRRVVVALRAAIATGQGRDAIFRIENIAGSGYNDDLTGSGKSNQIIGAAGADMILGFNGDDHLLGKGGNDELLGGKGQDVVDGGAGKDSCTAEVESSCES